MEIEINWNENKTEDEISAVNEMIESHLDSQGKFKLTAHKLTQLLFSLNYFWTDEAIQPFVDDLTELYKKIYTIFEELNIFSIPYAGTLLGFERDKGIIRHDDDIDLCVDYDDISKKYNELLKQMEKYNLKTYFNFDITRSALEESFNFPFWTKILSNNITRIQIGNYFFEMRPSCDLFPIFKFDNFSQYFKLLKLYINIYRYNPKFKRLLSRIIKIDDNIKKELILMHGEKKFKKIDKLFNKVRDCEIISENKDLKSKRKFSKKFLKCKGKYFSTLGASTIKIPWWKKEQFTKKEIDGGILYNYNEDYTKFLEMLYGPEWDVNPGRGPLHVLGSYSFKGKVKS